MTDLEDSNDFVLTFGTKINKGENKECFGNYKPILEEYFKSLASQKDISFPAVLKNLSNKDIENTVAEKTEGIKLDKPVEGTVIDQRTSAPVLGSSEAETKLKSFKDEGNVHFKAKKYPEAIAKFSEGVDYYHEVKNDVQLSADGNLYAT